jgi:AraC-like DNA-binding protein
VVHPAIEDHRRLDPQHARVAMEAVGDDLLEPIHARDGDVHDEIVRSRHEEHAADLAHCRGGPDEAIDLIAPELGELDQQQGLEGEAERMEIDLGVGPDQHTAPPQRADPFEAARRCVPRWHRLRVGRRCDQRGRSGPAFAEGLAAALTARLVAAPARRPVDPFATALALVDAQLTERWTIADLARAARVSATGLKRLFRHASIAAFIRT